LKDQIVTLFQRECFRLDLSC